MPHESISRRDLATHLAFGTAATVLGLSDAHADEAIPAAQAVGAEGAEQLSPLDLLMSLLLARYPSEHLSEEQIDAIRRDVQRRLTQSASLRQFPLSVTDAPALVFAAYRAEG